jgi:hypothetical protein
MHLLSILASHSRLAIPVVIVMHSATPGNSKAILVQPMNFGYLKSKKVE